jgi:hypothetical protein
MNCYVSARRMQTDGHSRRVRAVNEQGSLPPRNRTPYAKRSVFTLLLGEQWRHSRDIGHGFWWKRSACREMLFITRRTGMVGRKEACRSEAIVHLFKVGGAG